MKSPRRIFRSSARGVRPGVLRGLGLTVIGWTFGVVAVVGTGLWIQSSTLFGRSQPGPERIGAEAAQVAVVGGDTLRLGSRVVRLAGIEAPGLGDTCGTGTDCGGAATRTLAGLVRDHRVECRLSGTDKMGRPFGECDASGVDLSSAVVASGWARARQDRPALADLELRARRKGAGLWAEAAHN